ncbi:MAG: diguanylate cyclase [Treponema sp.]|nr:diguanylate cyclase [Treponema sp.]
MKRMRYFSAAMIFFSFLVSGVIFTYLYAKNIDEDQQKRDIVAENIYSSVHEEIYMPIVVSRTMAADTFLQEKLLHESEYSVEDISSMFAAYLKRVRSEMHYSSAFVISEKTRRYYSARGIEKLIDPLTSPYDIWYQLFIESGKTYDLDTDRDQANGFRWTVFVNYRITDAAGNLLGVCGVGVIMTNLQGIFEDYESKYKVKINLVDPDGLVQVDTKESDIENAYITEAIVDNASADHYTYSSRGVNGFRMTRYMKELEWYLVVQGINSRFVNIVYSYIILAVCALLFLAVFFIVEHFAVKDNVKSFSTDGLEDPVTGIPNREYLREAYGEEGVFNTTRYKSIAVFDVDNFRTINENNDGADVLKSVVSFANDFFAWKGLLIRWTDDDFVALLEMPVDDAVEKFKEFCFTVNRELGITVSVGVTEVNLSDTIKVNYYRAVQKCYLMKEKGGNGVCKN